MDIYQVKTELAACMSGVLDLDGRALTTFNHAPNAIDPPAWWIGKYDIGPYMTHGTRFEVVFRCYLAVSAGSDEDGQKIVDKLLSQGAGTLFAAIETARGHKLNGACADLKIADRIRMGIVKSGATDYYGAEIPIWVVGS